MTKATSRGSQSKIICTGKHTYGIENITVKSWGEGAHLFIGSFCSIAGRQTIFLGGNHRTDWATTFPFGHIFQDIFPAGAINGHGHPATKGDVVIENDVWIGHNSTIMSGIRVGSGSVIAANSVVVKEVAPYTIVGGNPAREIKLRFPQSTIDQLLQIQWWNKSDSLIDSIIPLLQQPLDDNVLLQIEQIASKEETT